MGPGLPGADYAPWAGDQDQLLEEIEDFLTGMRRGPDPDRVLATIMFGVHTGEVELIDRGLAGIGVHIGARVAALAQPGEVLVSSTV
jgi:class 3 adenylate cyclase